MKLLTIEDVPLYSNTLSIMKFWSFLLRHNYRRYLCLTSYGLINMSQFLDIYYSTEPIDAIVRNTYIAVLFCNTIIRGILLCFNRFKYERFMDSIRLFYIELLESDDKFIQKMLKETTVTARFISNTNLFVGVCSCFGFFIYPVFASSKVLPFGMYFSGVDKYDTPYYQIFFFLQVTMSPMGCCMYIPFTNLIVSFVLFAILMCHVLQHKLRNLKDVTNEKAQEVIEWCIRYQLELVKYVETINRLTSYIYLMEYLAFGAMLCAMLFLLIIVETVGQMVIIFIYITMIFSQSVLMYYFANELYVQSLNVAVAAYESSWFEFDVATQKTLQLLILRSQKPCAILVGKVYPMNLEMLQSKMNATYTYFTLLKRVYG